MKIAVVAHFDPSNNWSSNFIELLKSIEKVADKIFVVSTCAETPLLPVDIKSTTVIKRPNIGYDFYSYRVGIIFALQERDISGLFLINSSVLLLDEIKFINLLQSISNTAAKEAVLGVTSSSQFGWHIQSYLLYFNFRNFSKQWLLEYSKTIQPVNTKLEVVLNFEIGLSKHFLILAILTRCVYKPSFIKKITGTIAYIRSLRDSKRITNWLTLRPWKTYKDVNWTHFDAKSIATEFGFVKSEVLRTNPHNLNLDEIWKTCSKKLLTTVREAIDASQNYYKSSASGLTEFNGQQDSMGVTRQIVDATYPFSKNRKIAVVLHLYYLDLLPEILSYLINIIEPFDLFITTPFEADLPKILDTCHEQKIPLSVVLCNNKGRDIGPFISLYRTGKLDNYDAVLKLHSKKSKYSEKGGAWRRELIGPLCGDSLTALRAIALLRNGQCGLVGPHRYFLTHTDYWGANKTQVSKILHSTGSKTNSPTPELAFFGGSMFWFVPSALNSIKNCEADSITFEAENGKQDGTLAHAWERCFCLIAKQAGYHVTTLQLSGSNIFDIDNTGNRVPVLEST
ncbi:MAG: hypothetical protein H7240_01480 [Glaciimonas sp.]|nr:hypothetical protein [Glaciimonas sp.]